MTSWLLLLCAILLTLSMAAFPTRVDYSIPSNLGAWAAAVASLGTQDTIPDIIVVSRFVVELSFALSCTLSHDVQCQLNVFATVRPLRSWSCKGMPTEPSKLQGWHMQLEMVHLSTPTFAIATQD